MQPREFHHTAAQLATHGTRPADFRSAISRAYYATYHTAFELLEAMGFTPTQGGDAHRDVRDHLSNSGVDELAQLAGAIASLHGRRISADYRLGDLSVEKRTVAQAAVERADKIMYNLVKHCNGPERSQITCAISKWRTSCGRK